jgi:hypothetical protein
MKDLFVPKAQSIQLKELGFDEPCFGYYQGGTNNLIIEQIIKSQGDGNWCLSPTFSQAFEFFREKYQLLHSITEYNKDGSLIIKIYQNKIVVLENMTNFDITEYEETELVCLDKLIEITKNNK